MNNLIKPYSIMLFVKDLEKSRHFYQETMGLTFVSEDAKVPSATFTFPQSNSLLVLHSNADHALPEFNFLVEDVVAFCDAVRPQGFAILTEPIDVASGKGAVIGDFDNNRISIVDLSASNA